MNDIKVGEYVRTDDGRIYQVAFLEDEVFLSDKFYNTLKHSKNIIDLIEENDIGIMEYRGLTFSKFITKDDILELKFGNYKLLEILTKEQYKQNSYVVKE